jgi:hypothetical protein
MEKPAKLIEFLKLLRLNCCELKVSEVFRYIESLLDQFIRFRAEILCDASCDASCDARGGDPEIRTINKKRNGGKYEQYDSKRIKRIIFTADRNNTEFNNELSQLCDGLILEYPSWKVLSVPAPMFNPRFGKNTVIRHLDEYSIYELKDGTSVTAYWYANAWHFSTANGYSVNSYKWFSESTYEQIIRDVLAIYPEFSFDKLSKTKSYTFGFRHHDFHPLLGDPKRAWFIQCCDLSKLNCKDPQLDINLSVNVGIPLQETIAKPKVTCNADVLNWMSWHNSQSLRDFMNTKSLKTPTIRYGFVFRRKSSANESMFNDIIYESDLFLTIKRLVYNLPKYKMPTTAMTPKMRMDFVTLRAFLGTDTRYEFMDLFPQFKDEFAKYETILNSLRECISEKFASSSEDKPTNLSAYDPRVIYLAEHMTEHARKYLHQEQAMSKELLVGVLHDFVFDRQHINFYLNYLFINPKVMTQGTKLAIKKIAK